MPAGMGWNLRIKVILIENLEKLLQFLLSEAVD